MSILSLHITYHYPSVVAEPVIMTDRVSSLTVALGRLLCLLSVKGFIRLVTFWKLFDYLLHTP